YNHLKVYEPEVQKKSESNSQNMAFISTAKNNNGNEEVNTTDIPIASTQVSPAGSNVATASISLDTACAYIASQFNRETPNTTLMTKAIRTVEGAKTSKKSNVRGNQRNWNNLKSQQLGESFVMKNKACFNCGHFNHLSYDCGLWVKKGRACPKNNYTHKSMSPKTAIHKPNRSPMKPTRPNMNAAQPK
nr:ubiquitin hydrolase [Tanacetum cinerariifolium]